MTKVYFREGDSVKKGDLLFEIDPRMLQAQLNQAEANLARDEAQLGQIEANVARDSANAKYAQAEAVRYASLLEHGLISKEQAEQTRERVLEAARRVFVERGFEAATATENGGVTVHTRWTDQLDGSGWPTPVKPTLERAIPVLFEASMARLGVRMTASMSANGLDLQLENQGED